MLAGSCFFVLVVCVVVFLLFLFCGRFGLLLVMMCSSCFSLCLGLSVRLVLVFWFVVVFGLCCVCVLLVVCCLVLVVLFLCCQLVVVFVVVFLLCSSCLSVSVSVR